MKWLSAAGAEIEEVALPVEVELLHAVHRIIMETDVAAVHIEQLAAHREDYGPLLATEVDAAQLIPAVYVIKARRLRRKIRHKIDASLAAFDAWLLPTASILPPLFSEGWTGDPSFQAYWTLIGTPSITLPVGLSAVGLPIGLQLVGRRGEDDALLTLAAWVEGSSGGSTRPCWRASPSDRIVKRDGNYMGVLTRPELLQHIEAGEIRIDPFDESCVGPASIDLHLGRQFRVFRPIHDIFHVTDEADHRDVTEVIEVEDHFLLLPGHAIHGVTVRADHAA